MKTCNVCQIHGVHSAFVSGLSESKFVCAIQNALLKFFVEKHAIKMTLKQVKPEKKLCNNYDQDMQLLPVFPVLRSLVLNLRRFLNILHNCVIA